MVSHVSGNCVSVLILRHTLIQLVGLGVEASLTETINVDNCGNRDADHEPGEGSDGALGERGSI